MSNGIEVMKEKIRKKMTLDDLPSPKQSNPSEEKINVHKDVHKDVHPDVQPHSNTAVQQNGSVRKKKGFVGNVAVQAAIQQTAEEDEVFPRHDDVQEDLHTDVQPHSNTAVQQSGFAEAFRKGTGDSASAQTAIQQTVSRLQDAEATGVGILKGEEAKTNNAASKHSKSSQQQHSNTATHQNSDLLTHYNSNAVMRQSGDAFAETKHAMEQQNSKPAIQQSGKTFNSEEQKFQQTQPVEQQNSNTAIRQNTAGSYFNNQVIEKNKTVYGRKMTLYLTEEMYKAFNDIYAKRMLEGRKTEKSALICEAVELLHNHENK